MKRLQPDVSAEGLMVSNDFLDLNFRFLNRISQLLNQVNTQLSSRGWVVPFKVLYFQKKFLEYSRGSNPGPLGRQSDMLTTIPKRRSYLLCTVLYLALLPFHCSFHHSSWCTIKGRVVHSETRALCPIRNSIIIFILTTLWYDAIMKLLKHKGWSVEAWLV